MQVPRRAGLSAMAALLALAAWGCGPQDRASARSAPPAAGAPAPGTPLPALPETRDAGVALRRMVAAYKRLDSLYAASEATVEYKFAAPVRVFQTGVLRYRKQGGMLDFVVEDPASGTNRFVCDGTTLVNHTLLTNQFTRTSVRGGLPGAARAVGRLVPQILSPLSLLAGGDAPAGVAGARIVRTESAGGAPAHVVSGTFTPDYERQIAGRCFGAPARAASSGFTAWLDRGTCLIRRLRVQFAWKGRYAQESGPPVVDPWLRADERYTEIVQNPDLPESLFRFIAPRGAQEIYVESPSQLPR